MSDLKFAMKKEANFNSRAGNSIITISKVLRDSIDAETDFNLTNQTKDSLFDAIEIMGESIIDKSDKLLTNTEDKEIKS